MSVRITGPDPSPPAAFTRYPTSDHHRLQQIYSATRAQGHTCAGGAPCTSASGVAGGSAVPQWLADVRKELPLTDQLIYMQTGGHGPALDSVLRATAMAAEDDAHVAMPAATGVRPEFFKAAGLGSGASGSAAAQARRALGETLGCSAESVAVLSSTSIALYTVIMARQWREGDEMVISNLEHVCIASIAQGLEAQYGVRITAVPADQGDEAFLAALAAALSSRTKLVVLSHVASPTGHVLPVAGAVAAVRKHADGARVAIDGAQAIGQIPVDVRAISCDYYIGSGHKWLCGPSGTAFLYVSQDALPGAFAPKLR